MGASQQALIAAATASLTTPTPTFANISLLVHGDERPFIDVSSNKYPVANYRGIASVSSSQILTASGSGLKVPTTSAFLFGTGAWAAVGKVDCSTSGARIFDSRTSTGSSDGFALIVQATTMYPFVSVMGTSYGVGTPAGNLTVPANTKTDVTVSYDGTVLRMFVGGALSWSHTVSLNVSSQGPALAIGNTADMSNGIVCKLSELMIVKGETVYTTAFLPATRQTDTGTTLESGAAVTFSNVKLLLHGDGTNGSTTFTDSSTSARTPTVVGNAQISTAQKRFGSASMLFDGSGDRISYANSADFNFSGDFGLEAQIRPTTNTAGCIYSNYQNSTNGWSVFFATAAGRLNGNVTGDGADIRSQDAAFATNTWAHSAITRVSGILMEFVEITSTGFGTVAAGELVDFVSESSSITSTAATTVGGNTNVSDFNGHIEEVRIVKGEAPYVRSYAVQTAAHPDS